MNVFTLEQEGPPLFTEPVVLIIGTFDGVHLGHQALIRRGKEEAKKAETLLIALTFKTPPAWFFSKDLTKSLLTPLNERIELLHSFSVDHVLLMDFNEKVASLTAFEFLSILKNKLPLGTLILGHDATIGKDRENNRESVVSAAKQLGIAIEFLPACRVDGEIVSSTAIRLALEKGDGAKAKKMLGI